jgi:Ser/Thr protein kinase RdoA (MazF antagonist)
MVLQPDEHRSRRLKCAHLEKVADRALQQSGIFNAELGFVSDTGNLIFRADAANQSYSVRIYPEQSKMTPEIYGELYWLLSLKQNTNLVVPEPVSTLSGHFVQEISVPGIEGQFQVVLFRWISGEIIGKNFDVEVARQIGRLMAELHTHAATFDLPAGSFRDATDWRGMGHFTAGLTPAQISRIEGFLNQNQLELCEAAAERVAAAIDEVDDQQNFGLIHSDLHTNNCLLHKGKIGIIDFEDCQFAPFTCDMAITICSFDDFPNPAILREAFLQGYSEKRKLPKNHMEEIEAFMLERNLRLIRWVSTWPSVDHFSFGQSIIHNSLQCCKQYIESEFLRPTKPRTDRAN